VGIAQAIPNDPKILILDESTAGLDPTERVRFRNITSAMSKVRIVILSTHIVSDIESIANRVIMIKDRHIFRNDTVSAICSKFDGKLFETHMSNEAYSEFEQQHLILSARQEHDGMTVRFFCEQNMGFPTERACVPMELLSRLRLVKSHSFSRLVCLYDLRFDIVLFASFSRFVGVCVNHKFH